ncbi:hypothetical protein HanIR_Chr13g0638221 [Helianthus annuus]|nr:hypothetical protein HanIR_Chr13g0638221 [Helianthus annuus]
MLEISGKFGYGFWDWLKHGHVDAVSPKVHASTNETSWEFGKEKHKIVVSCIRLFKLGR